MPPVTCAMAKRFVTDACFDVANDALQLHGGYGYLQEFGIERVVRDLRVHQILEGTNEIMKTIVGKGEHHAVALTRDGSKLYDKPLPNTERGITEVLDRLAKLGPALVVVDQPATIGALPVAVAQAQGMLVGYLPGLTMRRVADLHPGEAKTDARDAFIIAETARTMPATLRSIKALTSNSQNSRCSAALMMISLHRSRKCRTGYVAYSRRFTPPWNECLDRG